MCTKRKFLLVALLMFVLPASADTNVGGTISTNTHWVLADSPYVVTSNIDITSGAELLIDPGVEVRFNSGRGLDVLAGQLVARGTAVDPILFTSNSTSNWHSIDFMDGTVDATFDALGNYVSGSIIEHAIVERATGRDAAIEITRSSPYITNSLIRDNGNRGLDVERSSGVRLVGNTFMGNTSEWGGAGTRFIDSGDIFISGNTYINNESSYAGAGGLQVQYSHNITISENLFDGNIARRHGGGLNMGVNDNVVLSGNTFTGNTARGLGGGAVIGDADSVMLSGNIFTGNWALRTGSGIIFVTIDVLRLSGDRIFDNIGDGVALGSPDAILSMDPSKPTWIYGNTGYDVVNYNPADVNAMNVWWGTLDEAAIQATIFDHYDNSSVGIVFYDPWSIAAVIVDVDIRPGTDTNPVNLKAKGVLPVAVLGSDDFDVSLIDLQNLTLEGVDPNAKGQSGKVGSFEDVNGDSILDLILHFDIQDRGIGATTEQLILSGLLLDGTTFGGTDAIRIVPPGDLNGDLVVDIIDLTAMAGNWSALSGGAKNWAEGDCNGDSVVDILDLTALAANWAFTDSAPPIPEPTALALLALGGIALLTRGSSRNIRGGKRKSA